MAFYKQGDVYLVYMYTAKKHGKKYIGITGNSIKERRSGNGYGKQLFGRALAKYGVDGFDCKPIIWDVSLDIAKSWEMALIAIHKTQNPMYGYNQTAGGDSPSDIKGIKSKEWLAILKDRWEGSNNPNARKVICLETLKIYDTGIEAYLETGASKITDCCKRKRKHRTSGGYHWAYYDENFDLDYYKNLLKQYKEEENKPRVITEKQRNSSKEHSAIPIICLETLEVFASGREAAKSCHTTPACICNCCKGKGVTAGGYHWMYYDKEKPMNYYKYMSKKQKNYSCKPVINLETLEVFNSIVEVEQKYGYLHANIHKCLCGKALTAYGYHWRYYDDSVPKSYYKTLYNNIDENNFSSNKPVIKLETLEIYNRVIDAARSFGSDDGSHIIHCCKGKGNTAFGYHWSYYDKRKPIEYYKNIELHTHKGHSKAVILVETGQEFETVLKASEFIGLSHSSISKCLKNPKCTAGGYHWKYADE